MLRDLRYADDCALIAHSLDDAQQLFDRFYAAAVLGLTVSLKKTEVMLQPAGHSTAAQPVIKAGDTTIKAVDRFCYLDSILSSDTLVDDDISTRLFKPAVPSAGSISVFRTIMASDCGTPKLPSTWQKC